MGFELGEFEVEGAEDGDEEGVATLRLAGGDAQGRGDGGELGGKVSWLMLRPMPMTA